MDKDYLYGIAKPRIEAEMVAREAAEEMSAADVLMESLKAEVAAARG